MITESEQSSEQRLTAQTSGSIISPEVRTSYTSRIPNSSSIIDNSTPLKEEEKSEFNYDGGTSPEGNFTESGINITQRKKDRQERLRLKKEQ